MGGERSNLVLLMGGMYSNSSFVSMFEPFPKVQYKYCSRPHLAGVARMCASQQAAMECTKDDIDAFLQYSRKDGL